MRKTDIVKTIRFRILPSAAQEEFFRRYEGVYCMLWNAGIDYQNHRCFGVGGAPVYEIGEDGKYRLTEKKTAVSVIGRGMDLHTKNPAIEEHWKMLDNLRKDESGDIKKWEAKMEKWRRGGEKGNAPKKPDAQIAHEYWEAVEKYRRSNSGEKPKMPKELRPPRKLRGYAGFKGGRSSYTGQWTELRDSDKHPEFAYLQELHSHTCRYILKRLDESYEDAFKGIRGYPSYKRRADFCSFTVPGGAAKIEDGKLRIPGAGSAKNALLVKMRPRRGMDKVDLGGGKITDVIIKREGENAGGAARWFAYIQCKYKNTVIPAPKEGAVGVDANVGNAAVWDGGSGDIIRLPDELVLQARRRRYQRAMSRKQNAALKTVGWDGKSETRKASQSALGKRRAEKIRARVAELTADGLEEWKAREIAYAQIPYISKKYAAVKIRAAKASRNIAGLHENWTHQTSRKIADSAGLIVLEDLQLKNMTKSAKGNKKKPGKNVKAKAGLNRAMLASCHGMLKERIIYKADWGGGRVEKVGAAYTSQTCAKCGAVNKKSRRATEQFKCVHCGHADNAQINAAKNILHKFTMEGKGDKPSVRGDGGGNPNRENRGGSRSVKRETPMKQKAKTAGAAVKQPDKSQRDDLPFV